MLAARPTDMSHRIEGFTDGTSAQKTDFLSRCSRPTSKKVGMLSTSTQNHACGEAKNVLADLAASVRIRGMFDFQLPVYCAKSMDCKVMKFLQSTELEPEVNTMCEKRAWLG